MCSLHSYMGYTQPLFIWGIMGLKNLYDTKSVIIYILGQEVEGDLKGPFMGSMFRGEFVFFFPFFFFLFLGGVFLFCSLPFTYPDSIPAFIIVVLLLRSDVLEPCTFSFYLFI